VSIRPEIRDVREVSVEEGRDQVVPNGGVADVAVAVDEAQT
jgi:hypothetical protein